MLGAYTTCTAMFGNCATITTGRSTTNSRPKRIQRAQRPALPVFFGVGRGETLPSLVPIPAVLILLQITIPVFGWFVSWISSVVGQRPHTLQELRRDCGSWSEVKNRITKSCHDRFYISMSCFIRGGFTSAGRCVHHCVHH